MPRRRKAHVIELSPVLEDLVQLFIDEQQVEQRHQDVLRAVVLGLSAKETADRLDLEENTVRGYRGQLRALIGAASTLGLLANLLKRAVESLEAMEPESLVRTSRVTSLADARKRGRRRRR